MNGVQRYLLVGLVKAILSVTLCTAAVVCLARSLDFINYIVNHGLSVTVYLYLIVLLMPSLLLLVLPIALFISIMFVYGKLMQDNEILAMRACGLSVMALARPVWALVAASVAIGYVISLYFIPISFKEFKDLEYFVRFRLANMVLREGQFNQLGPKITIYMRERTSAGVLTSVLIQDERDPAHSITVIAARAILGQAGEQYKISMENGSIQDYDRQAKKVSLVYFDRYIVEIGAAEFDTGTQRERGIAERHIGELLNPPNATFRDRELRGKALAEGHQRLSSPLLALTFAAIGLATLFGGGYSRAGSPWRLVVASLFVTGIQVAHMLIVNAASINIALLPAIHLLVAVPAIAGIMILRDVDRHAPRASRWSVRTRRPASAT